MKGVIKGQFYKGIIGNYCKAFVKSIENTLGAKTFTNTSDDSVTYANTSDDSVTYNNTSDDSVTYSSTSDDSMTYNNTSDDLVIHTITLMIQ